MSLTAHTNLDFLKNRNSKRAFLNQAVDPVLLSTIIEAAGTAVSSKNTQPWKLAILSGSSKDKLSQDLLNAFDQDVQGTPDYRYSPHPLPDEQLQEARNCGYGLFELKGIDRKDHVARKAHMRENYAFFSAPVAMILHTHDTAEKGTFLDCGAFLQSLLLAATAMGLGACPQYSVAAYPDIIRTHLQLAKNQLIICSIALGHPDPTAPVNDYSPRRLPISEYTNFHD